MGQICIVLIYPQPIVKLYGQMYKLHMVKQADGGFFSGMLSQTFKLKILQMQDRSCLGPITPFHKLTTKYYLTLH